MHTPDSGKIPSLHNNPCLAISTGLCVLIVPSHHCNSSFPREEIRGLSRGREDLGKRIYLTSLLRSLDLFLLWHSALHQTTKITWGPSHFVFCPYFCCLHRTAQVSYLVLGLHRMFSSLDVVPCSKHMHTRLMSSISAPSLNITWLSNVLDNIVILTPLTSFNSSRCL